MNVFYLIRILAFKTIKMTSLAVRATAVKNSDDLKKSTEVRFVLVKLPSTKIFSVDASDSGMTNCVLFTFTSIHIHLVILIVGLFVFLLNFKFRYKKCVE